jgi:MtrB/PioB family decaheme-associated outer membrane protein
MRKLVLLTGALGLAAAITAAAGPQASAPDPVPSPSPTPSPAAPQPWRLYSNRRIDARLQPNAGLHPPALFPLYSPETPDFTGDVRSGPDISIKASLTTLGIWNRSTSLFGVEGNAVSAKFEEFRDLREGVNAGLEAHARKDDAYLDVVGRHLGLADQDLTLEGGRAGTLALKLLYDETPHNYAFGARSLFSGVGTATLTISDRIRADLQGSSSEADALKKLADYVAGSGHDVDLGLQRKKVGGEVTLLSTFPITIRAQGSNEARNGVRPFSESFGFGNFVEVPWPVNYDTTDARVSAEYARPESRIQATIAYRFSRFDEHNPSLTFDNPFRLTDSTDPLLGLPAFISSYQAGPATGRSALYPSNSSHSIDGTLVVSRLPYGTSISALFSASFLRQDEPLLPFTTNSAIVAGAFSNPGTEGGTAPFNAADPANLPARTANAAINTENLQVRVSSKPLQDLSLTAQYRFYNLDNQSAPFRIPGLVREDAEWRVPGNPSAFFGPLPIAYDKHTASLSAAWDLNEKVRLGGSYTFERMDRSFREVAWMNDHHLKTSLDLKPLAWLELRGSYEYIRRDTAPYLGSQSYVAHGETIRGAGVLPYLRKFDEAERRTNQGQAVVTVTPSDRLTLSSSVLYGKDDYPSSFAGLSLARRDEYGIDVSYVLTDRLSVYAAYTFEKFRYEMAGRQWTPGGISDPYLSETGLASNSNWAAEPIDRYHTVGLGAEAHLIPKVLRLNLSYSFSRTRGRIGLSSPLGTPANDVNPFVPVSFDNVDSIDFHNLNADLEWTIDKRASLAAGYVFEKYRIDDYNYSGFTYTPASPSFLGLPVATSGLLMGGMLPWPYHTSVAYVRLRVGM